MESWMSPFRQNKAISVLGDRGFKHGSPRPKVLISGSHRITLPGTRKIFGGGGEGISWEAEQG